MSWIYGCFHSEADKFREREFGYIRELNKVHSTLITKDQERIQIEERYREEYNRWQSKEEVYIERINELQALLHQQEVVTKQYRIYEGNFQQDRMQLLEVQKNVEELKQTIQIQKKIIDQLEGDNRKYLEVIRDIRGEMKDIGENDSGYSSEINGPHITPAVLV